MTTTSGSKAQAGFTAIEVLMALSVLAIALMAVVATMGSSSALRLQERQVHRAFSELDERIERLRGMDPTLIIPEIIAAAPAGQPQAVFTGVGNDPDTGVEHCRNATITIELLTEAQVAILLGGVTAPDFDGNGDSTVSDFNLYQGVAPVRLTFTWEPNPGVFLNRTVWTIVYQRAG